MGAIYFPAYRSEERTVSVVWLHEPDLYHMAYSTVNRIDLMPDKREAVFADFEELGLEERCNDIDVADPLQA